MSFIIINFFKSSAFTYDWFDALLLFGFFSKFVISYDLWGIKSFKFFANLGVNILGVLFDDYLSNMLFELLKYLNESYLIWGLGVWFEENLLKTFCNAFESNETILFDLFFSISDRLFNIFNSNYLISPNLCVLFLLLIFFFLTSSFFSLLVV